jgi:hypothetical protein
MMINGFEIINGKVKIPIPCPDGVEGCLVAHYKVITLEEWEDMESLETLKEELRYSLPRIMLERVNVGAVKIGEELIVLKNRYDFRPSESELELYKEYHGIHHDYSELTHKSVIFDNSIIGIRGTRAIMEYIEYHELKYCRNCGKKLDRSNNEYHRGWGTCDENCYTDLVGVNLHEF